MDSVHKEFNRWRLALYVLMAVAVCITLQTYGDTGNGHALSLWIQAMFGNVYTIFISIVIEALPFIILGVLGSTLLEAFASPEMIRRIIPKAWIPGILIAGLLGIIFPFCECGLVPIVRKLVEKGVPTPLAVVFLLTVPIVNPIVATATSYAFFSQPDMVIIRLGGAYILAVIVGIITLFVWHKKSILYNVCRHSVSCGCGHDHSYDSRNTGRIGGAIRHGQTEFFDILRYLMIGAALAALTQVYFSREWLNLLGSHATGSVGIMMVMAFFLSICSGADAFVANTFTNSFSTGAIAAFLVYGPMIDLKNLLMLRAAFKASFVFYLVAVVTVLVYGYGVFINYLGVTL